MEKQVLITDLEEMEVLQFDQKPIGTYRIFLACMELIGKPNNSVGFKYDFTENAWYVD